MKYVILLFVSVVSFNSYACTSYEALVVGKIKSLKRNHDQTCLAKIEFTYFKPHFFCPLESNTINNTLIKIDTCSSSLKENEQVGGILSDDGSGLKLSDL